MSEGTFVELGEEAGLKIPPKEKLTDEQFEIAMKDLQNTDIFNIVTEIDKDFLEAEFPTTLEGREPIKRKIQNSINRLKIAIRSSKTSILKALKGSGIFTVGVLGLATIIIVMKLINGELADRNEE
jgi:hypothetical protein